MHAPRAGSSGLFYCQNHTESVAQQLSDKAREKVQGSQREIIIIVRRAH